MWAVHANTLHLMASCGDIWEHLDLFGTNGPVASIQSVFAAIECTLHVYADTVYRDERLSG